ncbi:cysteine-rich RLK (RECEPTOR-like protein kinase) 8 [Abeliophyllum distichum]|uniref:Cysteine-rich RLK (RECEPTOR-like protein kinase) 8 n=1 Tax=Abeliophyllum distichum TaxID=126358 RepID=A0ABD1T2N6_9LAMI
MEAEYVASCEAAKEAVWLKKFLMDIEVVPASSQPMTLYCDNSGVVANAKEPMSHQRRKHIERKYHLLREIVSRGDIIVSKIAMRITSRTHLLKAFRLKVSRDICKLCENLQNPTDAHWNLLKRLFRYIKGTLDMGLIIHETQDMNIVAYGDADWASCPDDRKSTVGYCVYLGDNLISWSSKKQQVVARSSTEAEYRALAHTTAEITWVQSLLDELKITQTEIPRIWCDNLGASALASNPVYHARTKHIELDIHFVIDKVLAKQLVIDYVPTADQTADILTKPLMNSRHQYLRSKLGVIEVNSSLNGGVRKAEIKDHSQMIDDHEDLPDEVH